MWYRELAEDTDITAVDSAFNLLTSPDNRVAEDAILHVKSTTQKRICRDLTVEQVTSYLLYTFLL